VKRKTTLRAAAVAFIASLLLAMTPLAAHAAISWGLTSNPPTILGYSHTAKSGVDHSSLLFGMTQITSSPAIPSGYMGANCRIFRSSDNALKVDAGYGFNPSNGTVTFQRNCNYGTHGTYYSYGVTALYNGSGNTYTYTYRSPDRTW
jgi:hypothetical protein